MDAGTVVGDEVRAMMHYTNCPNLADVLSRPVKPSVGHGADRPERIHLGEADVDKLQPVRAKAGTTS